MRYVESPRYEGTAYIVIYYCIIFASRPLHLLFPSRTVSSARSSHQQRSLEGGRVSGAFPPSFSPRASRHNRILGFERFQ